MEPYETAIDRAIREATERGEFDDLPGAGTPLQMRHSGDPDWWVKQLAEREQISPDQTMSLRREADGFPGSLLELPTEAAVRAVLDDFNERVKADWTRPRTGPSSPVVARKVDVDALVEQWRELRRRGAS